MSFWNQSLYDPTDGQFFSQVECHEKKDFLFLFFSLFSPFPCLTDNKSCAYVNPLIYVWLYKAKVGFYKKKKYIYYCDFNLNFAPPFGIEVKLDANFRTSTMKTRIDNNAHSYVTIYITQSLLYYSSSIAMALYYGKKQK